MKLQRILKSEYEITDSPKIVLADSPSCFGKISHHGKQLLVSWNSEMVEPLLCEFDNNLFIGADCKFAVFDSDNRVMLLLFCLGSNFLSVIDQANQLIVISELEVVILNKNGLSICRYLYLPDLVEDYDELSRGVRVICADGTAVDVTY